MGDIADYIISQMENDEVTIKNKKTGEIFTIMGTEYMYNRKYWDEKTYEIIDDWI